MGKIGRISPIKREISKEGGQTLGSSLSDKGYTMFPGTINGFVPYKERNGEYRTGLDPNALYIKKMPKEEADIERARVTAMRDELQEMTGLDLSSRAPYYSKMFDSQFSENERAQYVKLTDQINTFNLTNPQAAITFAWMRVHPEIAPNYSAWEKGLSNYRCPVIASCKFFVDDEEYQSEVAYKQKTLINKAINSLEGMTPTRQLKVAKLLGLPVSYNSKPELIYNELDSYIKLSSEKGRSAANVRSFNVISQMADENIDLRFRIKEAIDFNVYRLGKAGKIYEGQNVVADTEDELIEFLSNPKNQEDYLALQKKIDSAKAIEI